MQPFRLYRKLQPREFILVGGDCAQGGADSNCAVFLSKYRKDIPIVYSKQDVAEEMTFDLHPILEWIYDVTGIPPVVAFERSMGGASEMSRLQKLNKSNKYRIFIMPITGTTKEKDSVNLGWVTSTATRPTMLGDWKNAFDSNLVRIYDEYLLSQHKTFINGKNGKPQSARGKHDDGVISCAICWQLYQTEEPEDEEVDPIIMEQWDQEAEEIARY